MAVVYLDGPLPLAFAHRGGADVPENVGIENSLTAFRHAWDLGYRYLETDVRCTSDGVPYACHDESLLRLTGVDVTVASIDSASIEAHLAGGREPIVRLSELLEALPEARFNIDVKSDDAVGPTCAALESVGAVGRVCLAAFSHARIRAVRRTLPSVTTSASTLEVAVVKGVPLPVARRLLRGGPTCVQVPAERKGIRIVTPRFVRRAHELGLQVHVWTVDDPQEMHALLDLAVDGIVTDRTDVLKQVLTDRGTWSTA